MRFDKTIARKRAASRVLLAASRNRPKEYVMAGWFDLGRLVRVVLLVGSLTVANFGSSQEPSAQLLRLQRSKAYLEIESNAKHAQGLNGITYGNPGDVWNYPNSLSCLVVYGTGRYVLEKREEQKLGKPKIKTAEGTLTDADLQNLKGILEDEALKKITTPRVPDLPADTQALREVESLDLQIDHRGTEQRFTTVRERVKTGAATSMTSGPSNGMDTYLDNGAAYKKTLTPLMKWFEGLEKKSKSDLKDSKSQYCVPINIG